MGPERTAGDGSRGARCNEQCVFSKVEQEQLAAWRPFQGLTVYATLPACPRCSGGAKGEEYEAGDVVQASDGGREAGVVVCRERRAVNARSGRRRPCASAGHGRKTSRTGRVPSVDHG